MGKDGLWDVYNDVYNDVAMGICVDNDNITKKNHKYIFSYFLICIEMTCNQWGHKSSYFN
jgi:hypothetical protein